MKSRTGPAGEEGAIAARPRYHVGLGGMASVASSASIAAIAATSPSSHASHVALDKLAQSLVTDGTQRRLLAVGGQPLLDRRVRALQRAVHRRGRRVERRGDLARGEPEHVTQEQHCPLARRQVLERGDERELDSSRAARSGPRAEPSVTASEPHRLDQRPLGSIVRIAGRPVVDGKQALGRRSIILRHTFVAMRYSHERSELRPSKPGSPRQARSSVSWTASSASATEPSIR